MTDRILEPVERFSEILFGLIMALTITCAVSVATADRVQIDHMVLAALGCNLAWGIIDAGMYLMARLGERGHNFLIAKGIREAPDLKSAHSIIANGLPALLASAFGPAHLELIREKINVSVRRASKADGARLSGGIWRLYPCYFVYFSGCAAVCYFRRCAIGAARLQCDRHNIVVRVRISVRSLCWASAMDNRPHHGCCRRCPS